MYMNCGRYTRILPSNYLAECINLICTEVFSGKQNIFRFINNVLYYPYENLDRFPPGVRED